MQKESPYWGQAKKKNYKTALLTFYPLYFLETQFLSSFQPFPTANMYSPALMKLNLSQ